jgi:hypothetical protein
MILFLAQHPEAQDRLYREIQAAESEALDEDIDGDAPTAFACVLKMPYLENLILEAYRSHSTFSLLIERVVSSKGMELPSGQYLPPGTFVGINSAAMNRRPDVYGADAESFNPERWVRAAGESEEGFKVRKGRMDRAMMTFGYGSRSCIGKNIVQLELYKVMATVIGCFRIEAVGTPKSHFTVIDSYRGTPFHEGSLQHIGGMFFVNFWCRGGRKYPMGARGEVAPQYTRNTHLSVQRHVSNCHWDRPCQFLLRAQSSLISLLDAWRSSLVRYLCIFLPAASPVSEISKTESISSKDRPLVSFKNTTAKTTTP